MSNDMNAATVQQQLQVLKMIMGSMAGSAIALGVVALLVLPQDEAIVPAQLGFAILVSAIGGIAAWFLLPVIVKPLPRDITTPVGAGMARLRSLSLVQAAVCEAAAIVMLMLAFTMELNAIVVLSGLGVAAAAVMINTWPTTTRLLRVRRRLEETGARCPLDELASRNV
ncbi:hypothetical protein [Microlunatus sp. Y2014]|uniref:hypothetical protein n=1 Tax=Microlunatus sp. Y2014 TaxID=3418488 RepID=UPI003DA7183F